MNRKQYINIVWNINQLTKNQTLPWFKNNELVNQLKIATQQSAMAVPTNSIIITSLLDDTFINPYYFRIYLQANHKKQLINQLKNIQSTQWCQFTHHDNQVQDVQTNTIYKITNQILQIINTPRSKR